MVVLASGNKTKYCSLATSTPRRGFMDHQPTSAAPDAGSVLKFVASVAWRSKWLIGVATVVSAAVAFALTPTTTNTAEAWAGRAILRIGIAPTAEYILLRSGTPLAAIDSQRGTVMLISDPGFRQQVASQAAFEPATAATSRSMVASSLRGIVLDGDRDVALELSASSAADIQAAFHAVSAELGKVQDVVLNRRLELLQGRINDWRSRITEIEKANAQLNDRIVNRVPDEKMTSPSLILPPTPTTAIPTWNDLQDRIQQDESLKKLSEPSVLRLESNNYVTGSRSVRTLRFSLLAGLGMLLAMIVLTVVFSRPVRASAD
jgi:hypothetical protein